MAAVMCFNLMAHLTGIEVNVSGWGIAHKYHIGMISFGLFFEGTQLLLFSEQAVVPIK